jgi:Zn-dependent alcohol dehydrogenase
VKAFVKTGNQPGDAGVEDVPFVRPGAGEVSLRVASCGICAATFTRSGRTPALSGSGRRLLWVTSSPAPSSQSDRA